MILTALVELVRAVTECIKVVIEGQSPSVREELWRRHLAETEWMHKLLTKFSANIEKLIENETVKPATPKIP
jgi:hypothetical protein